MTQFRLIYTMDGAGSATAHVSADGKTSYMYPSYIGNGRDLGHLAHEVSVFIREPQAKEMSAYWMDEPGMWRWLVTRENDDVRIQIFFEGTINSKCVPEFETTCLLRRLATQIKGQLQQLLNTHGVDEYEKGWRHPFPMDALREITEVVDELKRSKD